MYVIQPLSSLSKISEETGGTYYIAATSSEIASVMATIQQNTVSSIDMTDSDGDGLYDVYEVNGIKLQNGQIIKTDPFKADSDDDGISDFDEVGGCPIIEAFKFASSEYSCVLCKSKSNPLEPDSDGDYYPDDIDEFPNKWNKSSVKDKYIDDTDSAKGKKSCGKLRCLYKWSFNSNHHGRRRNNEKKRLLFYKIK